MLRTSEMSKLCTLTIPDIVSGSVADCTSTLLQCFVHPTGCSVHGLHNMLHCCLSLNLHSSQSLVAGAGNKYSSDSAASPVSVLQWAPPACSSFPQRCCPSAKHRCLLPSGTCQCCTQVLVSRRKCSWVSPEVSPSYSSAANTTSAGDRTQARRVLPIP